MTLLIRFYISSSHGHASQSEDVEDEEAEGEDMEGDVDLTEVTNKFSSVRVGSTSNLTPWSAIAAGELSPTKDEQIVNTVLLLFLSTTTIHHQVSSWTGPWSERHSSLASYSKRMSTEFSSPDLTQQQQL
jgi:hypothetical protein